jgi:cystathionine beta-lyase family protein involved in aluminum resistance
MNEIVTREPSPCYELFSFKLLRNVVQILDALNLIRLAEKDMQELYVYYEEIAYDNQAKVLKAFQNHRVREGHFQVSSGYGYGDLGRDELESIYARVFGAEDAMVRSQIVSGTHAISACLLAVLRPGDELLSLVGSPYDTLLNVIGAKNPHRGSLIERGIKYREIALLPSGEVDLEAIRNGVTEKTRLVLIQRSRGYSLRPALTIEKIKQVVEIVRLVNPDTVIFVDNCYGEFTDRLEPTQLGVDLMAGSLIKNPGGGLVPSGGYILGRSDLVEEVAYHITAPGLGKELGASLISNRLLYQGLFMAPHTVLQALKTACLLAYVCEYFGCNVLPRWNEPRGDIVQAVQMADAEAVIRFCQIVQGASPVDSDVKLEYGDMPGYSDRVVMAAGTFVQGSSIELSCDAPLREPYTAYFQGALSYEHGRFVVQQIIEQLLGE